MTNEVQRVISLTANDRINPDSLPPEGHNGYFTSLTLENVRCFGPEPQTLKLADETGKPFRWTIILGENCTGKTTLLQCLAEFNPISNYRKQNAPDFVPRGTLPTEKYARVSETAHTMMGSKWRLFAEILATNSLSQSRVRTLPQKTEIETTEYTVLWSSSYNGSFFVVSYGYGAARRMGGGSLSEKARIGRTESLFDEEVPLLNAEEWLLQLDYSASKRSNIQQQQKKRRDQVIDVLKRILPDVDDIRFRTPTKEQPLPAVEFLTPDGWIPLRAIGHGYKTFMAWVVDFASRMIDRYPDSDDPLAEKAVVLIDEIDLHLHPTWQRQVIGYLTERFPNTQFIVTAHSPIFVQAAADANIVVLRRDREKGHVVIDNAPETIRNWRIDQLLTSDLFGIPSARPPQIEPLLKERRQLLSKKKLTAQDKARLNDLEQQIGPLPTGDTMEEIKKNELLDRTLDLLQKKLEESA